jgi:PAS domain S-box-containing protein
MKTPTTLDLAAENAELRARLARAEETLQAIRNGQADAMVQLNRELEERVRRGTAELQAVFDAAPIGLAIAEDPEGLHIRGNPALEKMFGLARGSELSRRAPPPSEHYRCLQNERELPVDQLPMQRAARGETVTGLVMHILRPDGQTVTVYSNATPLFDEQGRPRGAVGAFLDITERKAAEARLQTDLVALTRMHALSGRLLEAGGLQPLLQEVMDAAVAIAGAERGTLQLLEGESLRIVAHHGHQPPFLEFFAAAENRSSVCGEALRRGERVTVPDVESSPIFAGTASLAVLREAGVRAVLSTPLASRARKLLGILTIQWPIPYAPDEHDLWRLDLLARQAADMIERTQAELALARQREELQLILDSAPALIFYKDRENHFLRVNRAFAESMGMPKEQLEGRSLFDLYPREQAEAFWRDDQEVLASGRAKTGIVEPMQTPAGERWVQTGKVPCRDAQGNLIGVIGFALDITERKRAEEALRESELRYRAIGESIDYGVWVCAPDGRNIYASSSFLQLVGLTQEQCSNFGWGDVLHPDDAARTIAAWKECVRTGGFWDIEHRFRGVDGKYHPVLARGVPVRNDRGEVICWAGINLDIHRVKEAEEEIRRRVEELRATNTELVRFNQAMVGRELRMIELKQEVNALCAQVGQPPRYGPQLDDKAPRPKQ